MNEEQKEQKKQSRTFSVILYPDAENYNYEEVLAACCEYFPEWAYILHDKDTVEDGSPKKPHYHVVGRLEGSRTPQTVANRIGVPANYVDCKKGYTFKKGVRYLVHLDNPDKAQYSSEQISASCDISGYLNPYNDVSQASMVYSKISTECITDLDVLIAWVLEEGCYAEYRRGYSIWKDLLRMNKENFEKARLS